MFSGSPKNSKNESFSGMLFGGDLKTKGTLFDGSESNAGNSVPSSTLSASGGKVPVLLGQDGVNEKESLHKGAMHPSQNRKRHSKQRPAKSENESQEQGSIGFSGDIPGSIEHDFGLPNYTFRENVVVSMPAQSNVSRDDMAADVTPQPGMEYDLGGPLEPAEYDGKEPDHAARNAAIPWGGPKLVPAKQGPSHTKVTSGINIEPIDSDGRADPPGTKTAFSRTVTVSHYSPDVSVSQMQLEERLPTLSTGRYSGNRSEPEEKVFSYGNVKKARDLDDWKPPTPIMHSIIPEDSEVVNDASSKSSHDSNWLPPDIPRKLSPENSLRSFGSWKSPTSKGRGADGSYSSRSSTSSYWRWVPTGENGSARIDFTGMVTPSVGSKSSSSTGSSAREEESSGSSYSGESESRSGSDSTSGMEFGGEQSSPRGVSERSGSHEDGSEFSVSVDASGGSRDDKEGLPNGALRSDGNPAFTENFSDFIAANMSKASGVGPETAPSLGEPDSKGFGSSSNFSLEPDEEVPLNDEYENSNSKDGSQRLKEIKEDEGSESSSEETDDDSLVRRRKLILLLGGVVCCLIIAAAVAIPLILTRDDGSQPRQVLANSTRPTLSPIFSPQAPTVAPTLQMMPTNGVLELISSLLPDNQDDLADPTTPSGQALDWLLGNADLGSYSDRQIIQRFALATLYYSTAGDDWTNNDKWLSDESECSWYTSETSAAICTAQGDIDEIDLDTNNLNGPVPWTELSLIAPQILVLDFFENELSQKLSSDIGSFTSLLVLDVFNNRHTGSLPTELGQLRAIEYLDLSRNIFTGLIPTELSQLTAIKSLLLNTNFISGTIPSELGMLTSLRTLDLSQTALQGSVPQELCALQLDILRVDCDRIQCSCCNCGGTSSPAQQPSLAPIMAPAIQPTVNPTSSAPVGFPPVNIDETDPLYSLIQSISADGGEALRTEGTAQRFAFGWLQSPVNDGIANQSQLIQRYALATFYYSTGGDSWVSNQSWLSSANECLWFTAEKKDPVCNGSAQYVELDLLKNNLDGTIPLEVLLLQGLHTIELIENKITSSLPSQLAQLTALENLELHYNDITGSIPSDFGQMSVLQRLSLFDNNLISTIPTEIGFLQELELLDLGSNNLVGNIPTTIGRMSSLAGFSVFQNEQLRGPIPTEIVGLNNLQLLYLDGTSLVAPIPDGLCDLDLREFWSDCQETQCLCCSTCCIDDFGCV